MKLINRDTDYAVKALMHIAQNSKRFSVSELALKLNIPRPFLRKILQALNKKGILESYKGKSGGFCLAISPDQIFLTDLIRIFQGPVKIKDCIFNQNICPDIKTCPLKKKLDEIEKHLISELQSITLKTLIKDGSSMQSLSDSRGV